MGRAHNHSSRELLVSGLAFCLVDLPCFDDLTIRQKARSDTSFQLWNLRERDGVALCWRNWFKPLVVFRASCPLVLCDNSDIRDLL